MFDDNFTTKNKKSRKRVNSKARKANIENAIQIAEWIETKYGITLTDTQRQIIAETSVDEADLIAKSNSSTTIYRLISEWRAENGKRGR